MKQKTAFSARELDHFSLLAKERATQSMEAAYPLHQRNTIRAQEWFWRVYRREYAKYLGK